MTRVAVLGASGMLGHRVCLDLLSSGERFVAVTRQAEPVTLPASQRSDRLGLVRWYCGIDAVEFQNWEQLITESGCSAVVNRIGLVKQKEQASEAVPSILVNSLFPHRLSAACQRAGVRLVHLSTDCVFSGRRGSYREDDAPDPVDMYGRSKLLGEVEGPGIVTIRTSMVGWELAGHHSLLEWFAAQRGRRVVGYRRAIFSGVGAPVLSRVVRDLAERSEPLSGVYHVAGPAISKYDLLTRFRERLGWTDIDIAPDEDFACDRSLGATRFQEATGWTAPSWGEMIDELARDWSRYRSLRRPAHEPTAQKGSDLS